MYNDASQLCFRITSESIEIKIFDECYHRTTGQSKLVSVCVLGVCTTAHVRICKATSSLYHTPCITIIKMAVVAMLHME